MSELSSLEGAVANPIGYKDVSYGLPTGRKVNKRGNGSGYERSDGSLIQYIRTIKKIPLLTREEEQALGIRSQQGDQEAIDELVRHNLRFVVGVAKKYQYHGLHLMDLIQEGNIGLILAAKKFDPDKGFKFITYAVWSIRQAIVHALAEQGCAVRIPRKRANEIGKIGKTYTELSQILSRKPTSDEVAYRLNEEPQEVEDVMRAARIPLSLNKPFTRDEFGKVSESHLDFMVDKNTLPAEEQIINENLREYVLDALENSNLNTREVKILKMRCGFDGEPKTLEEIGEMMNLSRERVRQIEKRAKNKLEEHPRFKQLRTYSY